MSDERYLWIDRFGSDGSCRDFEFARVSADTDKERENLKPNSGRVFLVDDSSETMERVHPPLSDDERYQRIERIHFASAEELERIRPRSCVDCARSVGGDDMRGGRCGDCRRKRGEVEATLDAGDVDVEALHKVKAELMRLGDFAEMKVGNGIPAAIRWAAVEVAKAISNTRTSTPVIDSADLTVLFDLANAIRADRAYDFLSPSPSPRRGEVVAAIDKLRTIAAGKLGDDRRGGGR